MGLPRGKGMRQKVAKSEQRKRGAAVAVKAEKSNTVGPWVLALLVFVVCGSALVQILNVLSKDNTPGAPPSGP